MGHSLSLYLHFPYCWSKCHYCAFNSIRYDKDQSLRFLVALKQEIFRYAGLPALRDRSLSTIYLGGGTPSIFLAEQISDILRHCREQFAWDEDIEITMEANPGTVDQRKLDKLREAGVTRLSMGVQSLDDAELLRLGRAHRSETAREAYRMARKAGFTNINLDFIYALEDQVPESWRNTLDEAIRLRPEHLSAYSLMIEEGTRFGQDYEAGSFLPMGENRQIRFDRLTHESLSAAGYIRYEISNYSLEGYSCRHNLGYWEQKEYLGLGPGAHSYFGGKRFSVVEDIENYIERIRAGQTGVDETETIGLEMAGREALIFGLRKTEGVHLENLRERFPEVRWGAWVDCFRQWGLTGMAVLDPPRIRLTGKGLRLWDKIAEQIIEF